MISSLYWSAILDVLAGLEDFNCSLRLMVVVVVEVVVDVVSSSVLVNEPIWNSYKHGENNKTNTMKLLD